MSEPQQQPPTHPQGTPPQQYGHPSPQPWQPQGQPLGGSGQPHGGPGQPYGQPTQPAAYPGASAPAAAPAPAGGALGRVAFILALVSLAVGVLVALSLPVLIRGVEFSAPLYGAVSAVGNGLVLIVAIAALILGIVSVRRPGQHVLAGIAIGIAASEILGILVAWVSNLVLTLTYS